MKSKMQTKRNLRSQMVLKKRSNSRTTKTKKNKRMKMKK